MEWLDYQKKAAAFFSSLGLKAEIECKVNGVRGIHAVDVCTTGTFAGVTFTWIVECKAWKSNIPKEQVMALTSIVQDIGADRGFLLSEVGFQSGAILAARSSNITLTSLEDLSSTAERFSIDALIGQRSWQIQKAKLRLLELKSKSDFYEYNPVRLGLFGELSVLELLLDEALKGEYPVLYPTKGHKFSTLDELLSYADEIIKNAMEWDL